MKMKCFYAKKVRQLKERFTKVDQRSFKMNFGGNRASYVDK